MRKKWFEKNSSFSEDSEEIFSALDKEKYHHTYTIEEFNEISPIDQLWDDDIKGHRIRFFRKIQRMNLWQPDSTKTNPLCDPQFISYA